MKTPSDTFCVLPWMHLATSAGGELRVCCNSTPNQNFINKADGTAYTVYNDNIQEAWNSQVYTGIRKQFLDGEQPDMCTRCFREEASGVKSARIRSNDKWMLPDAKYEQDADFNIRYVDIRLGNLCNLKCRMCNPWASNQWIKEWTLIRPNETTEEVQHLSKLTWPEHEKTWDNLFSIVDSVEQIYLTGGEPTIIMEQLKLLDYCIDNGYANNIELKYNTNLTNIPAKLIDRWKEFKIIKLQCSIDAVGELDRYIRYPSNWNKIQENFDIIQSLDNKYIEIHNTVQMYNILRLPEFIRWAEDTGNNIYFNILNHPKELNIRVLPKSLKELAKKQLQPYTHIDKVQGIIDYMMEEDWSDYYDDFLKYTYALDMNRNENLYDLIPEFKISNRDNL